MYHCTREGARYRMREHTNPILIHTGDNMWANGTSQKWTPPQNATRIRWHSSGCPHLGETSCPNVVSRVVKHFSKATSSIEALHGYIALKELPPRRTLQ